jgi:hypothetical protein
MVGVLCHLLIIFTVNYLFNQQKVSISTDKYDWQNHTSFPNGEVTWHDAGCQAVLEVTCQEKTRRTRTKIQTNVLASGKKIGPDNAQ